MYSLAELECLMAVDVKEFLRILEEEQVPNYVLTYIAEDMGILPLDLCLEPLLKLSRHDSILVREGAIYGLHYHEEDGRVRARIEDMAYNDSHEEIRKLAQEFLDDD